MLILQIALILCCISVFLGLLCISGIDEIINVVVYPAILCGSIGIMLLIYGIIQIGIQT